MWFAAGYFSNTRAKLKIHFSSSKLENVAVQMRKRVLSSKADEVARNGRTENNFGQRFSWAPLAFSHFPVDRSPNRIYLGAP